MYSSSSSDPAPELCKGERRDAVEASVQEIGFKEDEDDRPLEAPLPLHANGQRMTFGDSRSRCATLCSGLSITY